MEFESESVSKYFHSFSHQFRRKCLNYYENLHVGEEAQLTKSMVWKFEKKHPELSGRCRVYIQHINIQTYECSPFHEHWPDLNNPGWFEDLCLTVKAPDIFTECGKSIRSFGRPEIIGTPYFYIFSRIPNTKYTVPKRLTDRFDGDLRVWWKSSMEILRSKLTKLIATHIRSQTLTMYLQNGKLDAEFRLLVSEAFCSSEKLRSLGARNIEQAFPCQVIMHENGRRSLKTTLAHLIEYLYAHVCQPVKFMISATAQYVKHQIVAINHAHRKQNQPIECTDSEMQGIVSTTIIIPATCEMSELTVKMQKEIAETTMKTEREGMHSNCGKFELLWKAHSDYRAQNPVPINQYATSSIMDTSSKTLDTIAPPYYHAVHFMESLQESELAKLLDQRHPISVYAEFTDLDVMNSEMAPSKDRVVVCNRGLSTFNPNSDDYESIEKSDLEIFEDEQDGQHYIQYPVDYEYKVIAPYTCHILDKDDKWHMYKELYNPTTNVSYLLLKSINE